MKKIFRNRKTYAVLGILLLLFILLSMISYAHRTFFRRLELDEIQSINIYSVYHYDGEPAVATLSEEETLQVYELLNQVELPGIGSDDFLGYTPYRTKVFKIELTNGTSIDFAPSGSTYIINSEKCFPADYDLSASLSELYYHLEIKHFPKEN